MDSITPLRCPIYQLQLHGFTMMEIRITFMLSLHLDVNNFQMETSCSVMDQKEPLKKYQKVAQYYGNILIRFL